MTAVRTPFTPEQLDSLSAYQTSGVMHPFTCAGGGGPHHGVALHALADGWHCPEQGCTHHQDWAHAFMADWSWRPEWMSATPDPQLVWEIAREHILDRAEFTDDLAATIMGHLGPDTALAEGSHGFDVLHDAVVEAIATAAVTVSWPHEQAQAERDDDVRAVAALLVEASNHWYQGPSDSDLVAAVNDVRDRFADRIAALDVRTTDGGAG